MATGLREVGLREVGTASWAALASDAFRGVAFSPSMSEADAARQATDSGFDEGLLRFVCDGEGPLGVLRGTLSPEAVGEVDSIGVHARGRGRGLGRWLLRRCEELLELRGAREVVLRVAASNERALRLYLAEGYAEVERWAAWEREFQRSRRTPSRTLPR
ncbi:MAG TPA: GNAT family N-acetyltransferase [Anaeromyxobacteraceae bacterium]|nr:GNAT family N-acetyltransferase [Anaeromyxobacteraceae bacterium]